MSEKREMRFRLIVYTSSRLLYSNDRWDSQRSFHFDDHRRLRILRCNLKNEGKAFDSEQSLSLVYHVSSSQWGIWWSLWNKVGWSLDVCVVFRHCWWISVHRQEHSYEPWLREVYGDTRIWRRMTNIDRLKQKKKKNKNAGGRRNI